MHLCPCPPPPVDDEPPATQRSPVSTLSVRDRALSVELAEPPKPRRLRARESGVFLVGDCADTAPDSSVPTRRNGSF